MGAAPRPSLWAPEHRALTIGLFLTITFVASEALAVAPALPVVRRDLGGLALYGFVFSGFMLGSLVGTVMAGRATDRRGPTPPFLAAVGLFIAGLLVGGLAISMPMLVAGRIMQGLGAGAIPAIGYASIGRSLPPTLQPRMLAMLSTAWVLPGLFAPAVSALVVHHFGWRWVFLGLIPFVALAAVLALPGLAPLRATGLTADSHRLRDAIQVAAGVGLFLGGLTAHDVFGLPAVVVGVVVGVPALRRLLPDGTLAARPGLPAAILARGLLTFCFFGVDSYVPLAVQEVRHRSPGLTGWVLTLTAVLWSTGSWIQAHLAERVPPRQLIRTGTAVVLVGVAGAMATLRADVPVATMVVAWGVAGFGMGLAYGPITLLVLRDAPRGQEGSASASLTLFDTLGWAVGAGLAGAVIAFTDATDVALSIGVAVSFGLAGAAGVALLFVSTRLAAQTTSSSSSRNGMS